MPTADGLTVLEDLCERAPATRVILMTAFADDETRARAEKLGALLIEEPFKMVELRAVACRLCQKAAARGAP